MCSFLMILMLCAYFCDCFSRRANTTCYIFFVRFSFCVFILCAWFLIVLADRPPLVAICVFSFVLCVLMLRAWLFDCFSRQATICCYVCVVFLFLCFDAMCMVFSGLADRPPLVAICVGVFFALCFNAIRMFSLIDCLLAGLVV